MLIVKNNKMLVDSVKGKKIERIPNIAFRIMTFVMTLVDLIENYSSKNFKTLDLKYGQTVIDYGCGPARYIEKASKTVGELGKVIAVDIHPLAIKNVKARIKKHQLKNVEAVLASGYTTTIDSKIADIVYALDMFHMIQQPDELLKELTRLIKNNRIKKIEYGNTYRNETKHKIYNEFILKIIEDTKSHMKCKKYDK